MSRVQDPNRWDAADAKRRTAEVVDAEVIEANRGGLIVRVLGLRAFLPASQVEAPSADWRGLVGQRIRVQVLDVNRRRNRVIVRQAGTVQLRP